MLCEARMAMDARQAHAMLDAARARPDLVAQVVPSPFTLRVDRTVRGLIGAGYLGDLLAVEVRDVGPYLDREAPLHWRHDADLSGLNVMSLGIWYEAILRWVGEATRVMAMGKTYVRMRRDAQSGLLRTVRVPEHLDVIADMACGAQAHLRLSSVTGLAGEREAWLFGSRGTLRFAGDRLYGGRRGESALAEVPAQPEEEGGWHVEEDWIAAILQRRMETPRHDCQFEARPRSSWPS